MSEASIRIPACRPAIGAGELEAVREVFESGWLSVGRQTEQFENELAALLAVKHVVAVMTGTAALALALDVLDLQPGDEVIVPSLTFAATIQAIVQAGGRPVFCEVEAATLNMDPEDVARRITKRTRALLPVHYSGYACRMRELCRLAARHGLAIVEDAAHAFGSAYEGRPIGSLGHMTCFSFNPVKNITCGEGGAIATPFDEEAERLRRMRNLGIGRPTWDRMGEARFWEYEVTGKGQRCAMANINAAIGLVQLRRRQAFLENKRRAVRAYDAAFAGMAGVRLIEKDVDQAFPYSYVLRVENGRRNALIAHLRGCGIGSTVHYTPNHRQPAFAGEAVRLPVTEQAYEEIVALPLYSEIGAAEVAEVIEGVRDYFRATDA